MPATGKKLTPEDDQLARLRRLEGKVSALKNGTLDINLGGATEELWVVTSLTLDGGGHVLSYTAKKLVIVDGVIEGIE